MFCNDVSHLSPLHQTSSLESFSQCNYSLCSKINSSVIPWNDKQVMYVYDYNNDLIIIQITIGWFTMKIPTVNMPLQNKGKDGTK